MTHPHQPQLGISSCLLGNSVRFDSGHKHNAYITDSLGEYFEFIPVCPEVAAGLGIPRPPIHLVKRTGDIRLVQVKNHQVDVTAALRAASENLLAEPQFAKLSGFILKKDSPSCGMERVKVYAEPATGQPPERSGVGLFAASLQQAYPNLPLEEEGRLCDPILRENFIGRVFVYQRWQALMQEPPNAHAFVQFHADHKYLIMAHDQAGLRELGQLVAQAGNADLTYLHAQYIQKLMHILTKRASRGQQGNVLTHLMGYLSEHLDREDRAELVETIQHYQQGYLPLIVPITLLKHHFRRHPHPYIERQYYLRPHPSELMLLNSI
ncbi:Uncharacterized conserved protein YbgA, DUF1722 family [Thiothrix eikelboomii]|uniref:Uncharacterized conserved protein YbgA, DUF1722 family n=1 Tax=Thiothrix eikelboomii TaxID=92487 RepID=A0A1T4XQJ8_9GAMM|nr:DUF523 and DUF1722 domain-containing protein [Thiothrix eikelboomii]SKA91829.1 Uncharacterized conserved protein YbgA, DUF1722 family [Thiothrix eikelboomii]